MFKQPVPASGGTSDMVSNMSASPSIFPPNSN